MPAKLPANEPVNVVAEIVPATLKLVAETAPTVIPEEPSRSTIVPGVALTSWLLNFHAGVFVVLKFKPALIVANPGILVANVSYANIAYTTPLNCNCTTLCVPPELSVTCAANAPVVCNAETAVGPTVIHPVPEYTFNWLFVVSYHKSPPKLLRSPGGLLNGLDVAPVEIFQLVPEYTLRMLLFVSHHNCPFNGFAGLVLFEKFSNNRIKLSFKNVP